MNIIKAIFDERLFRPFFKGGLETWASWITFFKVLSGESLNDDETKLFQECTGLTELPSEPIREIFILAGRRSGKSSATALLSAGYAVFGGWQKHLSKGEQARIFIVSPTKDQGQIVKGYLDAIFNLNPQLRGLVKRSLNESIELRNGVTIEIKAASWRATRGFTVGLFLMEELAYFRFEVESANVDKEIYTAVLPSMVTIPNSLVIGLSTPFARQGLLYEKFERHFGKPGPGLIWKSSSWKMNLSLSEEELRREYQDVLGPSEFSAEFEATFREDLETYLPLEIILGATVEGREFMEPRPGVSYHAFCDPSEGLRKGGDSMTFAVSHAEGDPKKYVLDILLEFRPPFDPKQVIETIGQTAGQYHITKIIQDRHAIGWISSDLSQHGIAVEASELDKSKIYEHFAVLMSKRSVELLDSVRLRNQLQGLMKFLRGGGVVNIDHLRGGHDDCSNSASGALVLASLGREKRLGSVSFAGKKPGPEKPKVLPLVPPPPPVKRLGKVIGSTSVAEAKRKIRPMDMSPAEYEAWARDAEKRRKERLNQDTEDDSF